jgi:hypothetical protein
MAPGLSFFRTHSGALVNGRRLSPEHNDATRAETITVTG